MIVEIKKHIRDKIKSYFENREYVGHGYDLSNMPSDRESYHIKILEFTPSNRDMYFVIEVPIVITFTFSSRCRDSSGYDEILDRINLLRSQVLIKKSENHPFILNLECDECRVRDDINNGNNYTIEMSLTAFYKSQD
jgi:hypothetical protein